MLRDTRLNILRELLLQVQPQLQTVNNMDAEKQSFARCDYAEQLEQAVNEQIKCVLACLPAVVEPELHPSVPP